MSGKLVLVTGVTGFIAGHVANQLLDRGYRVRGTTRGAKVKTLTETVKRPGLEFAQIDDVATSDLTETLKGVHAVLHVASPLPGRTSVDDTLNTAIEGTLNVLRQAENAGIEKIVVTSSFGAILDPSLRPGFAGINLTDSDWASVTMDDVRAKGEDHLYVYFASKYLAERATWDFAKEHPNVDIATILPGFVYGPFADHFPFPSKSALGTNGYPYMLIKGGMPPTPPPWFVDVRDIAKAHVLALELPPMALEQKRFLINAGNYTWKEAAEHIQKARPQVTTAPLDTFPALPGPASTLDTTRAKELLKFGDFITPQQTLEDFVDNIALVEASWA